MARFELTEDHLKLLQEMFVDFDDSYDEGAPAVGIKRPYGNGDVLGDVAEILYGDRRASQDDYIDFNSEGMMKRVTLKDGRVLSESDLRRLHRETATAMQIVLECQTFETGTYVKTESYTSRGWVRES